MADSLQVVNEDSGQSEIHVRCNDVIANEDAGQSEIQEQCNDVIACIKVNLRQLRLASLERCLIASITLTSC